MSRVPKTFTDVDRLRETWAESRGIVRETPVYSLASLSAECGGEVAVKAECLQRTGSFKLRGALAKIRTLDPADCPGVVAGSAGNHAQSLAYAARSRGLKCQVFMPEAAPISKVSAVRAFGASVERGGVDVDWCIARARQVSEEEGWEFVHPYDDATIVEGHAGVGLELADQVPDLGLVLIPVGGGGLAAGTAMALKQLRPDVRIVGVQSASWPAVAQSIADGRSKAIFGEPTLADGIAVKRPGGMTLGLLERWLDEIVTVDDACVAKAMVFLLERAKLVVEGAGAVVVGALMSGSVSPAASGRSVAVLSGGNVDANVLGSVIARQETESERRLRFFTSIPDRPGGLVAFLSTISELGGNVLDISHVRDGVDVAVGETAIEVTIATRGAEHGGAVLAALEEGGYEKVSAS